MSDRVEERREEQRIIEERLLRERGEVKRQAEAGAFKRVVASMQQSAKDTAHKDTQQKDQQGRASERLMARTGIHASKYANELLGDGAQRSKRRRENLQRQDGEAASHRQSLKSVADARMLERTTRPGLQANTGNNQDQRNDRKNSTEESREARESRREQVIAGAGNAATLQALLGVSPKSGSQGATGVHENVQQMIDEIVQAVYQGVDKNNFGFMHIELKSHVLSGSSLSLQNSREGVSLKVNTPDEEVARLLANGDNARELGAALKRKGVTLRSLEVNDQKVIR